MQLAMFNDAKKSWAGDNQWQPADADITDWSLVVSMVPLGPSVGPLQSVDKRHISANVIGTQFIVAESGSKLLLIME